MDPKNKIFREIQCFIIMPFEYLEFVDHNNQKVNLYKDDLDFLYNMYLKKAINSFTDQNAKIFVKRYESQSGNFMKGIVNELYKADIVIADITGLNPNVMYELGIRHTLKDNTILIAQHKNQIPSDLAQYIAVLYHYSKEQSEYNLLYQEFKLKIHNAIKEKLDNWQESDNPVRDFLEIKQNFKDEERIKEIKGNINITIVIKSHIERLIKGLKKSINYWKEGKKRPVPIIMADWSHFYMQLFKQPKDFEIGRYIYWHTISLSVIASNIQEIRTRLKDEPSNKFDDLEMYLRDLNYKSYQIYDLDENDNPISKSFDKIIADWEKELNSLIIQSSVENKPSNNKNQLEKTADDEFPHF